MNFGHLFGCGASPQKQLKPSALAAQSITRAIGPTPFALFICDKQHNIVSLQHIADPRAI